MAGIARPQDRQISQMFSSRLMFIERYKVTNYGWFDRKIGTENEFCARLAL